VCDPLKPGGAGAIIGAEATEGHIPIQRGATMSFTVPPRPLAPVHHLDDHRPPPPPDEEVWAEVMAAARLFGILREAGRSVRFDPAADGRPTRVRITDLDGNTIREVSPAVAVDPEALERAALGPAA
jgi:hypothetical protein